MILPEDTLITLEEVAAKIERKPKTIKSWLRPGMERFRADLLLLRHTGGQLYSTPRFVAAWQNAIDEATRNGEIVWRRPSRPSKDTRTMSLFPDEESPVVGLTHDARGE